MLVIKEQQQVRHHGMQSNPLLPIKVFQKMKI